MSEREELIQTRQRLQGAIENVNRYRTECEQKDKRIAELEAKLEAIEKQEPVGSYWGREKEYGYHLIDLDEEIERGTKLYAHPLRELSDEEIASTFEATVKASPAYEESDGTMPNEVRDIAIAFTKTILAKARGVK
ncbi:MAG: hypothetical protein PHP57_13830 [Sideroxydans sp.]|nr:hypothetical protein [Sideroxydans sp.]